MGDTSLGVCSVGILHVYLSYDRRRTEVFANGDSKETNEDVFFFPPVESKSRNVKKR